MINEFFSKQFITFLITGGIAAVVNFTSRIIYNTLTDFSTAIIFAYLTGMVTAFILARLFVFKQSEQKLHYSILFFTLVNLIAIVQTWLISMGLAYYFFPSINFTWHTAELAHAVGIIVPVFTSYIGHKYWSFR